MEDSCAICGALVKGRNKQNSKRRYCSKEHRILGSKMFPHGKLKGITINCKVCQKEFYISQCFIGRRVCCSYECANIWFLNPETRTTLSCKTCGKEYERYVGSVKKWGSNYCSKPCQDKGAELRTGPLSANWQGGKIRESHLIRRTAEYARWREAVFERDNYTCQHCGIRSGKGVAVVLHPHHIKQFAFYPELRFVVSNGLTVCRPCHLKIPHKRVKEE
jgi:5-methylcytosine-specific restriction endonuclease McrA